MTHPHPEQAPAPAARLVTTLMGMARAKKLGPLSRWVYGTVTQPMAAATGAATTVHEVEAFSTVAVAYAAYHAGRSDQNHGKPGTGLGKAMRQIGKSGAYGPNDLQATRAMDRLLAATVYEDVHNAVVAAVRLIGSDNWGPNWALLAEDLVAWQSSTVARDTVRGRWVRDFHTYTPRPDQP